MASDVHLEIVGDEDVLVQPSPLVLDLLLTCQAAKCSRNEAHSRAPVGDRFATTPCLEKEHSRRTFSTPPDFSSRRCPSKGPNDLLVVMTQGRLSALPVSRIPHRARNPENKRPIKLWMSIPESHTPTWVLLTAELFFLLSRYRPMFPRASAFLVAFISAAAAAPNIVAKELRYWLASATARGRLTIDLLGLLGILQGLAGSISLYCIPITAIDPGTGANCEQQPVYCESSTVVKHSYQSQWHAAEKHGRGGGASLHSCQPGFIEEHTLSCIEPLGGV
ncbi:hypothetical protein EDD16DRAFT_1521767 [Pisolithus croceorrhizus]|nr:hypothetical protein EDD16DRAFT_1521767 [Pisolithus croceorrhizus]KAI6132984.1 hypothetical protein EV401DRAFT_2193323 [Pisolithus croceorrhizus]